MKYLQKQVVREWRETLQLKLVTLYFTIYMKASACNLTTVCQNSKYLRGWPVDIEKKRMRQTT